MAGTATRKDKGSGGGRPPPSSSSSSLNDAPTIAIPQRAYGFPPAAFDPAHLPDVDTDFLPPEDLEAFAQALSAPDPLQSPTPGSGTDALLRSPGLRSSSSLDVTRRPSSVAPGADDEAQAQADVAALPAQLSQLLDPNRGGPGLPYQRMQSPSLFITAQNDWAPVNEKVVRPPSLARAGGSGGKRRCSSSSRQGGQSARDGGGAEGGGRRRRRRRSRQPAQPASAVEGTAIKQGRRTKDETREGYLYGLLKWPFLLFVGCWIVSLAAGYVVTRLYVWLYEHFVAWRGTRERLRRNMRATGRYRDWVAAARELDDFLGNAQWREANEYAYYDSKTVRRVWEQIRQSRARAEAAEAEAGGAGHREANGLRPAGEKEVPRHGSRAVDDLKALVEACVKNNFVGVENPRLYSQTYYGTKNLLQNFVDEGKASPWME